MHFIGTDKMHNAANLSLLYCYIRVVSYFLLRLIKEIANFVGIDIFCNLAYPGLVASWLTKTKNSPILGTPVCRKLGMHAYLKLGSRTNLLRIYAVNGKLPLVASWMTSPNEV
ncbi:hypothetical protein ES703_47104 [subsurface metagenome]